MELSRAFDEAIRKFYDGFDYAETTKNNPKMNDYSFKTLDGLHKEIVPKRKPVETEMIEEGPEEDVI